MFSDNELKTQYGRECRARQDFWAKLNIPRKQRGKFADWVDGLTASEFVRENLDTDVELLKELYAEYIEEREMKSLNSLGCKKTATAPNTFWAHEEQGVFTITVTDAWETPKQACNKKEETMNTEVSNQRYHLLNRASSVRAKHDVDLRNHFHMDNHTPASMREALDRIAKGTAKFPTVDKLSEMGYSVDGPSYFGTIFDFIDWRTEETDEKGYRAAKKTMEDAFTALKDDIAIFTPEKALENLRAFEAKTFH